MSFIIIIIDFVSRINYLIGNIIRYIVIFIMLTGVYEVFARYIFGKPTIWVWELNSYLLSSYIAIAGAYAFINKSHVKVDIIYDRLSPRVQAFINIFSYPFVFLFLGCLLWQAFNMSIFSISSFEHSQTLFGPPVYLFKAIFTFGVFIFLLQVFCDFILNISIIFNLKKASKDGI